VRDSFLPRFKLEAGAALRNRAWHAIYPHTVQALICPRDHTPLENLTCQRGHVYPSFDGIPVLLRDDVPATIWTLTRSLQQARGEIPIHED
jgi:uncharacterized protein YbaR (Trm112 family)